MLFLPPLGPFRDIAGAIRQFMDAETDERIVETAKNLLALYESLGKDCYAAVILFHSTPIMDYPYFTGDSSDPANYPWRKYDGALKRTQSIEVMHALELLGAANDKLLWDNAEYPLLAKFRKPYEDQYAMRMPVYSYPWIPAGYRPNLDRGSFGSPYQATAYDRFFIFGLSFDFNGYAAERILKEKPRERSWTAFTIDEINEDPWPFMIALREDIEFLNAHIEENKTAWSADRLWAEHSERSTALIGKVSACLEARPDNAKFWHDLFLGDAYDERRRYDDSSGDGLAALLATDVTGFAERKKRRSQEEAWWSKETQQEKESKQLWLFAKESLPKLKPRWLQKKEQKEEEAGEKDGYDDDDFNSSFSLKSPVVKFIADDPLHLFTADEKLYLFGSMELRTVDKEGYGASNLRWLRKNVGYQAPRTVNAYAKLGEILAHQPVEAGKHLDTTGTLFFEETLVFLKEWEAPAFSQETWKAISAFYRSYGANGDLVEYKAEDKLRVKVAQGLERDLGHIKDCPERALIKLNEFYEDEGLYPRQDIWNLAAREIVQRVDRAKGRKRHQFALLALKHSDHPDVQKLARSIWVVSHAAELGMDNGTEIYRKKFRKLLAKLNTQKFSWDLQHELLKELARETCIQPETATLCENHFEEKAKKAANSFVNDIGIRCLGLLTEAGEERPRLKKTIVAFLARNYDEDKARHLSAQILNIVGARRVQQHLGFDPVPPRKFLQSILAAHMRSSHYSLWRLPLERRAVAFSQLLISGKDIGDDAASAWKNGIRIVIDLLFPKSPEADEAEAKWTRWYRSGTRFYIESAHPTERSLLLSIMLGVAKQSPETGNMSLLEGAQRFAQLLNSFDPAHRKLSQSIACHPDIPLVYAKPFQSATYMAQEPPRWVTLKHQQYVLPDNIKKSITWYGPLLGFASFYMTHGVTFGNENRVTSVLHRNAREAAEKGFKRLDYTIRHLAKIEPSFRAYLPIALDTIEQARSLAIKETDINYGRQQLQWMMDAMHGQSVQIDGKTYTRQVVPWLQAGNEDRRGAYKLMPWIKGQRLGEITDEAERGRVASSEIMMTLSNIVQGVYDTDGHTGNRLIEGNTVHVFDVGGMVREERGPGELLRLFAVAAKLTEALPKGVNPSQLILDAIQDEERKTGKRPADLVRLNKTMIAEGEWLRSINHTRLPLLIKQALG